VVPATGWANFDDHDLELPNSCAISSSSAVRLIRPEILPQLIAEHVLQIDQFV
jgi:hypothetical protein